MRKGGRTLKNELVRFKGMADGVCIYLNDMAPMYEILDELERKINSNRTFFGIGGCRVSFGGRVLSASEKRRLTEMMEKMMPLARVEFEQPKKAHRDNSAWVNEYKEKHGGAPAAESAGTPAEEMSGEDLQEEQGPEVPGDEEFISRFRSTRARLYQGIVHEGAEITSDGHLILLGTAEKGSMLSAVGDIIVIGGLYGYAHAGRHGHNGSYIIAMDMKPEGLAIADAVYAPPDESEEIKDEVEERHGFFGKFKKKNEQQEIGEDITQNSVHSAIALWKNHKIILDNFTIKTFTNPKNMI